MPIETNCLWKKGGKEDEKKTMKRKMGERGKEGRKFSQNVDWDSHDGSRLIIWKVSKSDNTMGKGWSESAFAIAIPEAYIFMSLSRTCHGLFLILSYYNVYLFLSYHNVYLFLSSNNVYRFLSYYNVYIFLFRSVPRKLGGNLSVLLERHHLFDAFRSFICRGSGVPNGPFSSFHPIVLKRNWYCCSRGNDFRCGNRGVSLENNFCGLLPFGDVAGKDFMVVSCVFVRWNCRVISLMYRFIWTS